MKNICMFVWLPVYVCVCDTHVRASHACACVSPRLVFLYVEPEGSAPSKLFLEFHSSGQISKMLSSLAPPAARDFFQASYVASSCCCSHLVFLHLSSLPSSSIWQLPLTISSHLPATWLWCSCVVNLGVLPCQDLNAPCLPWIQVIAWILRPHWPAQKIWGNTLFVCVCLLCPC